MKKILSLLLLFIPTLLQAQHDDADSTYKVEKIAVTSIKQGLNLRNVPIASSVIGGKEVENNQIHAMRDMHAIVPNFFIPEYGSRITSSIYSRGLGTRIDQPVVGLNINNIPYLNKNAFDTDVLDISRIEVLRGPQSTLYGRNTMGGVVNIYTLAPMNFQGTKIGAEYSSGNTFRVRGAHYAKLSDRVAASAGAFYDSSDGLFTNEYSGKKCDTEQQVGGDVRVQYSPSDRTFVDATLAISNLNQGGYPYYSLEREEINYNDNSSYDRMMLSGGTTVRHSGEKVDMMSITGYQYLDDAMHLDQDFSPDPIFTLTQATREHSITEDIVVKSKKNGDYSYLFGAFGFFKNQNIAAPVTFKEQGIEQLILDNINGNDYYLWDSDSFVLSSDFTNNTFGTALYHESKFESGAWEFSAGMRVDYEWAMLKYNCTTDTGCKRYNSDDELVWVKPIVINMADNPSKSFLEFLPRASATYHIDGFNSLYATIAKGYKAGGFNTQMFSDILQQELMERFGLSSLYSTEEIIAYKPEYSWNYEIGGHFTNNKRTLLADVALFYIDCRDQQLTVFPLGMVTGRMMTNAGKSRSYGAEFSTTATLGNFRLSGSYGYTNAKFAHYDDNKQNYSGNYIPYSPQHTLYGSATFCINIASKVIDRIELEANTNGAGAIYWNESNSISQPFYALLGSSVRFIGDGYSLALWGRNMLNEEYNTFYFKSMGNEFVQQSRPATYGITLNITL